MWAIDLLASAYGWTKATTLNTVYPDELRDYYRLIRKRELRQKADNIEVEAIPNMKESDRKQSINRLTGEMRALDGIPDEPPKLDRTGLQRLKNAMRGESRLVKIK